MSSRASETLARLRVCRAAGLPVPPDLHDAAIECLERISDATILREQRDSLIRRAALLLPPQSKHQVAAALATESRAMYRTWHVLRAREPREPLNTTRDCLHAAALRAKLPQSQRQFYRVLVERAG